MNENQSIEKKVMDAIQKGGVRMRPKWHFVLSSLLAFLGVLILSLALLYAFSLALFFMRDSGVFFAPSFGPRGWWDFLQGAPWLLLSLVLIFIVLLEHLVRRYSFVYKKPLLISALVILLFVALGGYVIAQTQFHRQLAMVASRGQLPPPMKFLYDDTLRMPPPREVYRGVIADIDDHSFVIVSKRPPGTTTIIIGPRTRLPFGGDFSVGELILVVGDVIATDTIRAFGVREVEEW